MKKLVGLCLFVAYCILGVCLCYADTGESFTKVCSNEEAVSGSALVLVGQVDYEKSADTVSYGESFGAISASDSEAFSHKAQGDAEKFVKATADDNEKYIKNGVGSADNSNASFASMAESYNFTAATSADILQTVLEGKIDDCPEYYDVDGNGVVTSGDAAYMLQAVLG